MQEKNGSTEEAVAGVGELGSCSGGGILRKINRDSELSADLLLLGLSL